MNVYKFSCTDCRFVFYVENQGQFDGPPGACPMCKTDEYVIDLGNVIIDEQEERDPIKDIEKWARICVEVEREKKVNELMEELKK